ncbi:cytochrome c [Rheinheimera sp. UJ51]|uniref:c-type cytochrome n=1 Tax=unclassified Rheinheimera TaxID=115860 RepID=UPI001E492E61|nr:MULTISPECIES: cytochrome c [unclassified Rheinheimera]MCC5452971.1 cytochrome c [Rheinheimera sp. UJ51]MCF4009007.1 cytochrome c [Rheinheimera sp. UJ63]
MKKALISSLLCLSIALPVVAATAFTDGKDAVSYRQANFQMIRHNMGDIQDMIRGNVAFDVERVQRRAEALALLSQLPWETFTVPGTQGAGGEVKPAIWDNLADVQERGEKLAADAAALLVAAKAGEQAAIRKAFSDYARNCKACHDKYKAD